MDFGKVFMIFITYQLFLTSCCQQIKICKLTNSTQINKKSNLKATTIDKMLENHKGDTGENGNPGKNGSKGDKGEKNIPSKTLIQTIVYNSYINQLNSLKDFQTILEKEIKTLTATCIQNQHVQTKYFVEYCSAGMKYGDSRVKNSDIRASSYYSSYFLPKNGRLNYKGKNNIWAGWATTGKLPQWLQVNLKNPTLVTGVITQGRKDTINGLQYITSYKIAYGNTTSKLQEVENDNGTAIIFLGNIDNDSYKMNRFPKPITATYFRLIALSSFRTPALRMDYITC